MDCCVCDLGASSRQDGSVERELKGCKMWAISADMRLGKCGAATRRSFGRVATLRTLDALQTGIGVRLRAQCLPLSSQMYPSFSAIMGDHAAPSS